MLNLAKKRLNYRDMLCPPVNFHLDFAIGATYSLDLHSLVGTSLFMLPEGINSDRLNNDILSLDSLIKHMNRIALFCEKGQIHFNNKRNPLYILLENMVFQVTNDNYSKYARYASFHPKFWLLRFKDDNGSILYRLIVLSKNLTFDRSWDVSIAIDGKIGEKQEYNAPLKSFINYLLDYAEEDKVSKMVDICKELDYVNFELEDEIFDDYEFIVNGIDEEYIIQNTSLFKEELIDELLIISPFLSENIIRKFNERINPNSRAILITQADSLLKLTPESCSNFDVYIVRGEIIDGESFLSNDSENFNNLFLQDIHAKVYIAQYKGLTEFYLGSLNASCNALKSNVEVMVKLSTTSDKVSVQQISESLFNFEGESPFEKVDWGEINNENHDDEENLEEFIKYIVRLNSHAKIISCDDFYNIELEFKNLNMDNFTDLDITIQPLFVERTYKLSNKIIFENLNKKHLSKFYIITINKYLSRIIKIETEGMPEDRFNDVISSIINNEFDFLLYVSFLLGDDFVFEDFDFEERENSSLNKQYTIQFPELYEKMLKTLFYNPGKFDDLDVLIQALSNDNVMPKGFKELYDTFKRVRDDNGMY